MKAFVTGSISGIEEVRSIYQQLVDAGHSITHDWTQTDSLGQHVDNSEEAGRRAAKDIDGVVASDAYIFVSNHTEPGRGMYAELGAALASLQLVGKPAVFVIGSLNYPSVYSTFIHLSSSFSP